MEFSEESRKNLQSYDFGKDNCLLPSTDKKSSGFTTALLVKKKTSEFFKNSYKNSGQKFSRLHMLSSQSYLIELQHALEIRTDRSLLTKDADLKCTAIS